VIELSRDLERGGFETWCVGGAVRDALLGHPHLDWDLATDATPDDVRRIFGRKRTIPVGIDFGTVGVLDRDGVMHEVTTFRRDVHTDGRHAVVEFGASLDEDLARRDFTINAIAVSPRDGEIRDPFDGRGDLRRGVVRAVGEPQERMREDRLRALRGIRFSARFGFELDARTWDAIRASAPHLTRLSAERVKQELDKTMEQVSAPSSAIRLWRESGAAAVLLPETVAASALALSAMDCAAQPGPKRKPGRRIVRLAALFSDADPEQLFALAARLRFSKHEGQWLAALVQRWRDVAPDLERALAAGGPDRAAVRKLVARIGRTHLHDFFRLAAARWCAARRSGSAAPAAQAVQSAYRRCLRAALSEPVDLRDLAVDGDDLRQAGITPGPGLGMILSRLLESVIEDPGRNVRDRLLDEARRLQAQLNQS
jgi:tRNA nucleotidyltransferase/poly(A) polymerase